MRRVAALRKYATQHGMPVEQRNGRITLDPLQYQKNRPLNTVLIVVPQGNEYIVERMGKYHKTLEAGYSFLYPFADKIQYAYCIKEQGFEIPTQFATTADNVVVDIDGILFLKIIDTFKASYNIENPIYNVINFAQTTMRSEIARLNLDNLFKERTSLNQHIAEILREEAKEWGIECKRYEIRDITVSELVRRSMDLQAEAERRKRKLILDSEGEAIAEINRAGGLETAQRHAADAHKYSITSAAAAEADGTRLHALALSEYISVISKAIEKEKCSEQAAALSVAEKYITQFGKLAQETNTVLMSHPVNDPGLASSQALGFFINSKISQKVSDLKKDNKQ